MRERSWHEAGYGSVCRRVNGAKPRPRRSAAWLSYVNPARSGARSSNLRGSDRNFRQSINDIHDYSLYKVGSGTRLSCIVSLSRSFCSTDECESRERRRASAPSVRTAGGGCWSVPSTPSAVARISSTSCEKCWPSARRQSSSPRAEELPAILAPTCASRKRTGCISRQPSLLKVAIDVRQCAIRVRCSLGNPSSEDL